MTYKVTVMLRTRMTKSGEAQQYGEPHSPKSGGRAPRAIRILRLWIWQIQMKTQFWLFCWYAITCVQGSALRCVRSHSRSIWNMENL